MAGDQQPVNPHDEHSEMADDGSESADQQADTGDPGEEARLPGEAPATHFDGDSEEPEEQ